ncbi:16S rRNA (guanine(527)-N(7))-methyltransferase RsmG [Halarcobacter bivalviorum]|uniref:Ribosomal RNA small subunit methyltransferase G n=1 Tax=Halarcobacter bivalviorum TaxID=663364 RepID=A0AAX2AF73_9BACT|nr:16S rRNA (guanine(527)-N(7))-methyltransferase RsmG [Halarcobacter bivalviorum]AXH12288.1 16S rRNA m7G527 methyltransferase [Halarcobacter bivalviorum]RXK11391.1 16S rRNA (guanine(527)-N(7))-methyltransferase RsmG [Halarcobacter bivalviorum]
MLHNIDLEKLKIDKEFFHRCDIFITLLQKWGKVHNLSGRLTKEDIEENIIDSISPLEFIDNYDSFADIGTGAGYPGLILAMAKADKKSYLIEPRQKRVAFLNFVKNSLGLKNVEVLCKRVEEVEGLKVDLVTSRAVTNTKLLLDITANISTDKTSFLFYKGSLLESEIEEAKLKNCIIHSRKDRNYLYLKGKI